MNSNILISGEYFNAIYPNEQFYRLEEGLQEDYENDKYIYENKIEINNNIEINGGLLFTDIYKLPYNINDIDDVEYYLEIKIPNDASVYIGEENYLTNKLLIIKKNKINDHPIWEEKNEEILKEILEKYPRMIKFIREPSDEWNKIAIDADYKTIKYMNLSEKMQYYALEVNPDSINYITKPSEELILRATELDPLVFIDVSGNLTSKGMLKYGINKYMKKSSIKYVKICDHLLSVYGDEIEPIKGGSEEMIKKLIEENENNIKWFDDLSDEICMIALKKNKTIFKYIKNPSEEIKLLAVILFPKNIKYLDETSNKDIYEVAIIKKPEIIKILKKPTKELIKLAIKMDGSIVENIVVSNNNAYFNSTYLSEIFTESLYLEALNTYPKALKYINQQTYGMCVEQVNKNGKMLKYVIDKNKAVCAIAIGNKPSAIKYMSEIEQSKELCTKAIKIKPKTIKYIKNPSIENYLTAISLDSSVMEHMNDKKISKDIYFACYLVNIKCLKYIEDEKIKEYIENELTDLLNKNMNDEI